MAMKTLNKNFKVTSKELKEINQFFADGNKLIRKVKLYGAGCPSIPGICTTNATNKEISNFVHELETTHAKFKTYESIEDVQNDSSFWRSDIVPDRQEIELSLLPNLNL